MGNHRLRKCSNFVLFWSLLVLQVSSTPVSIPLGSVSDLLIQSALDSLNENSPTHHTYKSGNLISAQKLLEPPYVIYRLTLNLEPNCNSESSTCSREACAIDLRQHELGVIDVQKNSMQCMYIYPQSPQDDIQQQQTQEMVQDTSNMQDQEIIESFDKRVANESVQLDHEVQTVTDGNDRPFVAVRAADRNYCPGCPFELNPTLAGLAAFGEQVVQSMDDSGRSDFKHKVVSIVRVTRAVPPGSNVVQYELLLEIGETNCLRTGLSRRTECSLLTNVPIKLCLVRFEERPWRQNSRRMTRNNCTDIPAAENELDGRVESRTVIESLASSASLGDQSTPEATPRLEIYDQVAEEGKLGSYGSAIDEFFGNKETTIASDGSRNDETKLPVTEESFTKIVLSTEDVKPKGVGFTDKIKEFDEFLEDFDVKIKPRDPQPVDQRTPVTEEIIRPEVVMRPTVERNAAVATTGDVHQTEQLTRTKRSLVDTSKGERGLVRKLAEKALNTLDDIDLDNKKRVVLKVIDSKKQEGDGTVFYVTMKVAPTECDETNKNVNDCLDERREPVKICKVHIHTNDNAPLESAKVLQSQCYDEPSRRRETRVRRSHHHVVGGRTPKNVDDPEIINYADKGLRKYSQISKSSNEPYLVEILEATAQVVSGMIYRIKVRLGESTCPKGKKIRCELKSDSEVNDYLITIWSQPWIDHGNPDIKIELDTENEISKVRKTRQIPGGETQKPIDEPSRIRETRVRRSHHHVVGGRTPKNVDDPEIINYADKGLRKYSQISKSSNEPYLVEILEATAQVVSGMIYRIKVRLGESTCPKGKKIRCELKSDSEVNDYLITIWSQPWVDHGNPDIKIELDTENEISKVRKTRQIPGGETQKPIDEPSRIRETRVRRSHHHVVGGRTPKNVDDPEIINYADKGLRKYSQISKSSNEPYLVEILEATAQVVSGMIYRIKVRLGESTCPKGKKIRCELKSDSEVNDYLITIWSQPWIDHGNPDIKIELDTENEISKVRKTRQIPGGETQKPIDDPKIVDYAHKGLRKYSETSGSSNEPFLIDILEATAQVVSGMLYKIKVRIGESTCAKGTKHNCQLLTSKPTKEYLITVWSQPWIDHGNPDIKIELTKSNTRKRFARSEGSEGIVGGLTPKSTDDPEIKLYAEKGLRKFSETCEGTNEPYLVEILEATAQVVSGMMYRIKVRLGESTCAKGTKENCELKADSEVKNYLITVWSQPWIDHGNPDIKIEEHTEETGRSRREAIHIGWKKISSDDPKVKEYGGRAVQQYTESSDTDYEPLLAEISEALVKTVSGKLYKIKAKFGESTCPKGTKNDCQLKENGESIDCLVTVWSQSWKDNGNPEIKLQCDENKRDKRYLRGANYSAKMLKLRKNIEHEKAFNKFMEKYKVVYKSEDEKTARFRVFKDNMKLVENLRSGERGTAEYGVTMFADLTPEEFRSKYTGYKPQLRHENDIPLAEAKIPNIELPKEFDWRHYNVVTEVKNQGACGSCWAFAVTGNIEGLYALKHGKLLSLSEQELVDCDTFDDGCAGGLPDTAYRAIEKLGGLETESDYPYAAENEKCHFDKSKARVSISSGLNITTNETQMAQWLVKNGPISIGINANAMQFYVGGISHPYKFLCRSGDDDIDHGVLIVGYGVHTYPIFNKTIPFWIIKNSWGPRWGEQGYYRVYRGDGTCGVNKWPTSAVVV